MYAFFAIACAFTWTLASPLALAWQRRDVPSRGAVACAGLSAFGPTIAAFVLALRERTLRAVFGNWRTRLVWPVVALFTPLALHLAAIALDTVVGHGVEDWFHPPTTSEQIAALLVFPVGEEFGWRGYAYPRMTRRFGALRGSLMLGAVWGAWHLVYSVTPERGELDLFAFALLMLQLPLYSLLIAWAFERSQRSMIVAIAFHAGVHLDHIERVPAAHLGVHAMHLAVLTIAAGLAARALGRLPHPVR